MLYMFDTCRHLIRTLPTMQHDPRRPEDMFTDGDDHCAGALRYAVASRPWMKEMPEPVRAGVTLDALWRLRDREQERWRGEMTTLAGCYVGNPHGNAPAAMDAYERSLAAFAEATGPAANCMNAFCSDGVKGAAAAVEQMGWTVWSWSQSPTARKMVPVVGMAMLFTGDQAPQIYGEIAAGKYDATWCGIANAWATHGFSKFYFRIGWEHNG